MKGLLLYITNLIFGLLPETRCFGFKRTLLKISGVKIGENTKICSSAKIIGSGKLTIGDNTWIGPQCLISASSEIIIGSDCDIAPRVYIGDGTHNITPKEKKIAAADLSIPIKIGNGCWLCVNSIILPGVSIGNKCVIAAGCVVTKSFEQDLCLLSGVPARIIRDFRTDAQKE